MRRSSADRGQTEPYAALVAVVAMGLALSLYAGVLSSIHQPAAPDDVADRTLDAVRRAASDAAVVNASRLEDARAAGPPHRRVNATLWTKTQRWASGPVPDGDVAKAETHVPVGLGTGEVTRGRLTVRVW
jgi:hypothetical protein